MEAHGIKETKEALVGVNELAIVIAKHLKDGAQASDIMAVVDEFKTNPELMAKLEAARDNIAAVPEEIKDISWLEGGELVVTQVSYVPKLIEALKK